MDLVKKNLLSIICGVAALLCLVALFFPLGGMYDSLQQDVAKSANIGSSLKQEKEARRNWPVLNPTQGEPPPLSRMPTAQAITAGKKLTEGWTQQATQFLEAAIGLQEQNLRPLVAGALPNGAQAQRAMFQWLYAGKFAAPTDRGTGQPREDTTIAHTILNGGMPPTEQEIKWAQDQAGMRAREKTAQIVGETVRNQPEVDVAVAQAIARAPEQQRLQAARKFSIYVDPQTSLVPTGKIAGSNAPSVNSIFDAQVKLWVIEDMCSAIARTNRDGSAGSTEKGVMASPIKRLVSLTVTHPYRAIPLPPGTPPEPTPPALPADPQAKVEMNYLTNPLGQKSNQFYDVVTFKLQIVCVADVLPDILTGLSAGHYVMFQNVQVQSIDAATHAAQGFLYGDKPVIQVTLDGQYLMLRRFIGKFMPPDVIRGVLTPEGTVPGAENGMMMPGTEF